LSSSPTFFFASVRAIKNTGMCHSLYLAELGTKYRHMVTDIKCLAGLIDVLLGVLVESGRLTTMMIVL